MFFIQCGNLQKTDHGSYFLAVCILNMIFFLNEDQSLVCHWTVKRVLGIFPFLKDLLVSKNVISKRFHLVHENKVPMHLALHQFKNPVFLFKVTDTLKSYKKIITSLHPYQHQNKNLKTSKQQIIRTTVKDQIDGRIWHKLALIDPYH